MSNNRLVGKEWEEAEAYLALHSRAVLNKAIANGIHRIQLETKVIVQDFADAILVI